MKIEVTVDKKSFTNQKGEVVEYYEFTGDLLGVSVKLKPDLVSARLARYVLDEYFKKK